MRQVLKIRGHISRRFKDIRVQSPFRWSIEAAHLRCLGERRRRAELVELSSQGGLGL